MIIKNDNKMITRNCMICNEKLYDKNNSKNSLYDTVIMNKELNIMRGLSLR